MHGHRRLIVRGLPASIDSKTLRVTVEGGSVQLGGVDLAKINEGRFVSEAERDLRRKIEETGDQRSAIQDDVDTAETQLKLLDSLAANPVGSATGASEARRATAKSSIRPALLLRSVPSGRELGQSEADSAE